MQVDAHVLAAGVLDRLDQIVGLLGLDQRGHVLDADGVGAHVLQLLGQFGVLFVGVQRADGVADAALGVLAGLFHGVHGPLQVAGVVQRIEHAEHVHAVLGSFVDEAVNHIIGVVAITQQVLAAQQHLGWGVLQILLEGAQALPGIFVQEADAAIESSAAPAFQGPVAGGIQILQGGDHVFHGHAGGHEALVRIAQNEVGDFDDLVGHGEGSLAERGERPGMGCPGRWKGWGELAGRIGPIAVDGGLDHSDQLRLASHGWRGADWRLGWFDMRGQVGDQMHDPDQHGQEDQHTTHTDDHDEQGFH